MSAVKYWVVIPASGIGQRMQNTLPKQYLTIAGKPIINHALLPFINAEWIEKIIVVLAENDSYFQQTELAEHKKIAICLGDKLRHETVLNGLLAIRDVATDEDWVLVHDAVRPCLKTADLMNLVETIKDHSVGGILARPVTDTLKQVDSQQQIIKTLSREHVWQAMTPQMFRYGLLLRALLQIKTQQQVVTDEAAALEQYGYKPLIVSGRTDNIKITYPQDLGLAEYYLQLD